MRKILGGIAIFVALVIVISIVWIIVGQRLSLFLDRFGLIKLTAVPVKSISYEGTGTGGVLLINQFRLSLIPADTGISEVHVGTTKDEQVGLAYGGKVFAFGPLRPETETLSAERPAGDDASITTRHSVLSWPTPFDFNFMTGQSPSWKRHLYYRLSWKKASGAKLEMLWRFEQYFYSGNGWASGFMTHEGSTSLIHVDVSDVGR
jgi:hypothetical protein